MTTEHHRHMLEFDDKQAKLLIWRVFSNGEKVFYTEISFEELARMREEESFSSVCERIGEALILDSSVGRKIFEL